MCTEAECKVIRTRLVQKATEQAQKELALAQDLLSHQDVLLTPLQPETDALTGKLASALTNLVREPGGEECSDHVGGVTDTGSMASLDHPPCVSRGMLSSSGSSSSSVLEAK
ncbi:unnamed protein product [Symbiodinium natans]|uniref:Uncharacterized protein n=1 Tax=Symbiodinium natans TaxID=878477 RepID=A0A812QRH2_9DINO|nr:unnamed protein product [Symbiodinium natans]